MTSTARAPSRDPASQPAEFLIRPARPNDVAELVELENRSFTSDRLSRRSFQHILTRGHAICLVAERPGAEPGADAGAGGRLVGYAIVLLHGNTSLARLYSLAVATDFRGRGVGRGLLGAAEARAREAGCAVLRLEVRQDNEQGIAIYRAAGYRQFAVVPDYYEDHAAALRMERQLAGGDRPELSRVPYYAQSLEFTCGPAALMMAMHALDPSVLLDPKLELRLWRESTLVFMTSGHGGCGPRGLAIAAWRRGFAVELFVTDMGVPFLDSVRSAEKKEAMRLVHEDFVAEVKALKIPVRRRGLGGAELARFLAKGAVPIVLISSYRIYGEKNPHWVVVTGADEHFIYIHDPFVDWEEHKSVTDSMNVPIARAEFDRMARFGNARLRAAVVLTGRRGTA